MSKFISIILKLILAYIVNRFETNKQKQKEKDNLLKEAKNAIKNKDNSALTAIFDRINRRV